LENTKTVSVLLIILSLLILTSAVQSQVPPETECSNDFQDPACQKPKYTDEQNEYVYDLDSSAELSGAILTD